LSKLKAYKESLEDFEIYFCVEYECGGKIVSEELVPNGSNIKVTQHNLDDYITKRIEYVKNKDKPFINEIKTGLFSMIPEQYIYIFNSAELYKVVNGNSQIDVDDWRVNTIYKEPYYEEHEV
jgi:hypothetical protein